MSLDTHPVPTDYRMQLNNYLQANGGARLLTWEVFPSGPQHQPMWTAIAYSMYSAGRQNLAHCYLPSSRGRVRQGVRPQPVCRQGRGCPPDSGSSRGRPPNTRVCIGKGGEDVLARAVTICSLCFRLCYHCSCCRRTCPPLLYPSFSTPRTLFRTTNPLLDTLYAMLRFFALVIVVARFSPLLSAVRPYRTVHDIGPSYRCCTPCTRRLMRSPFCCRAISDRPPV